MELLLAERQAGLLAPEDVQLGDLPDNSTADMRRVADDMRLLVGLRLAVGDDRPLPYSARFAAKRLGWDRNPRRASRALDKLCKAGVIIYAGSLPARGMPHGTKTYVPPSVAAAFAGAFEHEPVEHEPVSVEVFDGPTVEPAGEVEDQAAVGDAEPVFRVGREAASWNDADGTIHEPDLTDARGDRRRPRLINADPLSAQERPYDACAEGST